MKKDPTKIVELKNSINEMRNALQSIRKTAEHMGDRIRDLEDRKPEMTQE